MCVDFSFIKFRRTVYPMILSNLGNFVAENSIVYVAELAIGANWEIGCMHYNDLTRAMWRPKSPAMWLGVINIKKIKAQHYSPFVMGIHRWPVDSPQKRSVIRNAFACFDVTIHMSFRIVPTHALVGINFNPFIPKLHNVQHKVLLSLLKHDNELLCLFVHLIDQQY